MSAGHIIANPKHAAEFNAANTQHENFQQNPIDVFVQCCEAQFVKDNFASLCAQRNYCDEKVER